MIRLAIALVAFAAAAAEPQLTSRQRGEDFDSAWRAIEQRHAYPEGQQPAWRRARDAWRQRAVRAASRDEFVAALEGSLAELHDDHVTLSERSASSPRRIPAESDVWARWSGGAAVVEAIRTYGSADVAGLKPGARVTHVAGVPMENAVRARLGRHSRRGAADQDWAVRQLLAGARTAPLRIEVHGGGALEIERTSPAPANGPPLIARRMGEARDLGYIRFKHAIEGARLAEQFDGALDYLKDTRALILDLREMSAPGSRAATLAILGRFVEAPTAWQRRQPRGAGPMVSDTVMPRGAFAYRAPLVVLVDRWTAGEGEALAAGLSGAAKARLVGTAMAGLRGELGEARLPNSAIVLRFPAAKAFHVDGTPRERLRPAVEIDLAAPSGGPGDPILYQALKLLEPSSAPARRTAPR
jgi:carboxyl-terminal processing protease